MYRTMFLLKRLDTDTHEVFQSRWLSEHIPLVEKLPGIRHIVKNGVTQVSGPAADYDAITEIVWESEEAFHQALSSAEGQACVEDVASFTASHDYVVVEIR